MATTIPSKEIKKEEFVRAKGKEDIEYIEVICTYYSNLLSDCGKTDNIGANNKYMKYSYIAMPREFDFGTKINLEGMGIFECQDRGGAIKRIGKNTIIVDIYIPNATEAEINQLGRKKVRGYIIR